MKQQCEFCLEMIDTRGMLSHIHFRHRAYVVRKFSREPIVMMMCIIDNIDIAFRERALPAPKPDTKYSLRPIAKMLAPLPWMKVPKGYGMLRFLP